MISRVIIRICLFSLGFCFTQDIQVKMLTKSYFDVPFLGKVYLSQTTYLSNNRKNTIEKTDIETRFFGFIAGLVSDIKDTTGTLIDEEGQEWEYNINDKEYWKVLKENEQTSEDGDNESKKNRVHYRFR